MFRPFKAVALGLLTGIVGLVVSLLPFGLGLEENVGLDLLFKLRGARQPPSDVIIVSIDKASAINLNLANDPKKWPRSLHARLTERLAKAGAVVIAFDVMFDEARSSADDHAFAGAISRAGNVVLFEYLTRETVPLTAKGGSAPREVSIERRVPPIPPLAQSAAALAPFPLPKVPVKVSQYWTFKAGAGDAPTLPVVVFHIFALDVYDEFIRLLEEVSPSQGEKLPREKDAIGTPAGVGKSVRALREIFEANPVLGQRMLEALQKSTRLSVDERSDHILKSLIRMYLSSNSEYLNFYGPAGTIITVPYYQVLNLDDQSLVDETQVDFNGKVVFVGLSEQLRPGRKDGFYTVFSQPSGLDISGVEIAATAFANLKEAMPVRPLRWWAHLATMLLWGGVLGVVCRLSPTVIGAIAAIGLSVLYLFLVQYQFTTTGTWYPLILPLVVQVPLAFFGGVLWRYFDTNKERQNIRKAFEHYLPSEVVDQLSKNLAEIKSSGRVVYAVCLHTDIAEYTALGEKMDPEEVGSVMEEYCRAVFTPVVKHGGRISDVTGDSMLALWEGTQPGVGLRAQACLAALDIASAVDRFNQSLSSKKSNGVWQLPTRIGLDCGEILVRNIGAFKRYEYRVFGDAVNTASRLQALNKRLGTRILVSREVVNGLDGFLTRELGEFVLAGKSNPVGVQELMCRGDQSDEQQRRFCTMFAEAVGAWRRQSWAEAIDAFSKCIKDYREDGPSHFYVQLCEEYRTNQGSESWSGVVRMVKK